MQKPLIFTIPYTSCTMNSALYQINTDLLNLWTSSLYGVLCLYTTTEWKVYSMREKSFRECGVADVHALNRTPLHTGWQTSVRSCEHPWAKLPLLPLKVMNHLMNCLSVTKHKHTFIQTHTWLVWVSTSYRPVILKRHDPKMSNRSVLIDCRQQGKINFSYIQERVSSG